MPVYDGINGVVRKRKEWPVGIDGVVRQQKEHWAGIDGVKRRIFNSSKPLSSFSVGDIVKAIPHRKVGAIQPEEI